MGHRLCNRVPRQLFRNLKDLLFPDPFTLLIGLAVHRSTRHGCTSRVSILTSIPLEEREVHLA